MAMRIQEFTGYHDNDPNRISRIRLVVADHPDSTKRTQYIDAQIAVDLPTGRNGALLRAEALKQAIELLRPLETEMNNLGRQASSMP
jgi:hypothetical protein